MDARTQDIEYCCKNRKQQLYWSLILLLFIIFVICTGFFINYKEKDGKRKDIKRPTTFEHGLLVTRDGRYLFQGIFGGGDHYTSKQYRFIMNKHFKVQPTLSIRMFTYDLESEKNKMNWFLNHMKTYVNPDANYHSDKLRYRIESAKIEPADYNNHRICIFINGQHVAPGSFSSDPDRVCSEREWEIVASFFGLSIAAFIIGATILCFSINDESTKLNIQRRREQNERRVHRNNHVVPMEEIAHPIRTIPTPVKTNIRTRTTPVKTNIVLKIPDHECCICCNVPAVTDKNWVKIHCPQVNGDTPHYFHQACIDSWLNNDVHKSRTCPMCRGTVRLLITEQVTTNTSPPSSSNHHFPNSISSFTSYYSDV